MGKGGCTWLLGIGLLCCWPTSAHADNLKIVDTLKAVPFHRSTQPETQTLQYLLSRLPAPYELVDLNRSRARIWTQNTENACMPWLRKTPQREQEFYFSQPYMVESAIVLVTRRQGPWTATFSSLAADTGAISLTQLMAQQKPPVFSVDLARSYGDQLDPLLQTLAQQGKVMQRNAPLEQLGNNLQMLEKGFVDATLEYPKIVARSGLTLQLWPLQEADPFNLVYFACSKTSAGAQSVSMINQLIQQAMQQQDYLQLALAGIPADQQAQALQFWQQAITVPFQK
jgi:uncharacterized protein (TIGR02285 family)